VLLGLEDRRYLLTASHVFENAIEGQPLAAIVGNQFVIARRDRRWRTRPSSLDSADRVDLAVVALEAGIGEGVPGVHSLTLDDVDPFGYREELALTTSFLAVGYPRTKQPKTLREGKYAAIACHFVTHREVVESANAIDASDDLHIAIGYDREDFVGSPSRVSEMPNPEGMSGGGLWRVPFAMTSPNPTGRLVAILIEHHARKHLILGSRIREALRFLRTLHPANASEIDSRFPGIGAQAT
jgi:hypothetical protein